MPDPTPPTDLDLARLCVFATLHGGQLPDVPHRVIDTYRRLDAAKLVTFEEYENTGYSQFFEARITPKGQAVVEAMVAAGKATASGITPDIPEPME